MTDQHKPNPGWSAGSHFQTGDPPMSTGAYGLYEQARFCLNWMKARQIFSYLGQGPFEPGLVWDTSPYCHLNPDVDYPGAADPYFAVITKSEELDNLYHPIGGVLNAWRYSTGASVKWKYSGGSNWEQLFTGYQNSHSEAVHFTEGYPSVRIPLTSAPGKGPRDYGVEGSGYTYHRLSYSKLMVGGLALWTMPDTELAMDSDLWSLFSGSEFGVGKQVRGSETVRRGIGKLFDAIQELKYRTSRCLLQSGHPLGVSTGSETYVDIRTGRPSASGDASTFRMVPKALFRGATLPCTPAVVAWSPGATVENPSYVEFYSAVAGDTCEIAITSGTEAIYSVPAGLQVAREDERLIIEAKAFSGGAVAIRSYALWED